MSALRFAWLGLVTGLLLAPAARSLAAAPGRTEAKLHLAESAVKAGETVRAGVLLKMPAGWHTYWRNPGDSGTATKITWHLPPGFTAGTVEWPVPEVHEAADLFTYVYKGEVMLMVPIAVAASTPSGRYEIKADVSWLECKESCLPGKAALAATLEVGAASAPSAEAALFQTWLARLPAFDPVVPASARWDGPPEKDTRALTIEIALAGAEDFFAFEAADVQVSGATKRLETAGGKVRFQKTVTKFDGDWPRRVEGLAVMKGGSQPAARVVIAEITGGGPPGVAVAGGRGGEVSRGDSKPLVVWLLLAFVGGLILNVMPCVLPVIALKVLGFVNQSREEPARVRKLGVVYALGVLVSFAALAGIVVAVKAAGQRASWGMQFGNPVFIVLLTTLVTLVALNLFGVFEVLLGGRAVDAAGELSAREGVSGAFFNGVLATALATPCTAPFLGAALGFAFAQPPAIILLVFMAAGLGLAIPYVALSWHPGWLRFLPRPGAWMEKFKIAMGFPMLATAVWLFTLAIEHYRDVIWLGVFLICVSMAAWVYGEFVQRGRRRKGLAAGIALAILAFGYGYCLEIEQRWRTPSRAAGTAEEIIQDGPDGIAWRRWSPAAVAKARSEGRPVLVDFTAKWCFTCIANLKTSIEIASVRAKLKEIGAVSLIGDYTRTPDEMTDELARFGRAGVPLVLVYPADATKPPEVLPELLTPSIMLDSLSRAAGQPP